MGIMAQDKNRLIWVDLEMSGLNPLGDRILEVACVVTDNDLNAVYEIAPLAVHQSDAVLDNMDAWNKSTHARSGLIDRVKQSPLSEQDIEDKVIAALEPFVPGNASPMCGNSICQDRRFLAGYMPRLEAYFHYRNLDVSTLKELAKRWKPEVYGGLNKENKHQALADIYDSISELKYYREHFLKL
jgi:oligoribonuclease